MVDRLTQYGELSVVQARALRSVISKRMARAKRDSDGVRIAVEQAIDDSHGGSARSSGSSAELTKRLRAGLDRWALESLFAPRASSMATCSQKFRLSTGRCESLLAAAGQVPLARVGALASMDNPKLKRTPAPQVDQPTIQPAVQAAIEPEPAAPRAVRESTALHVSTVVPQPLSPAAAAALDAQPLQMHQRRKTQLPEPLPPAVAQSRADYDRQRAAYWARRRQELEARLVQIRSTGGGQPVQRGPASELEREVVGLSPAASGKPNSQPATKPARQPAQLAHNATPKAEPGAETADLIDDLTADPLGKQGQ